MFSFPLPLLVIDLHIAIIIAGIVAIVFFIRLCHMGSMALKIYISKNKE